jgi:carbon storage regulator CsrA
MLVLTRREGETIQFGENITVTIAHISERSGSKGTVKLAIHAPPDVLIPAKSWTSDWSQGRDIVDRELVTQPG